MNNYVSLLSKDMKKLWSGLDFFQKLAIIILVIVTAVAISYFIAKSTEPQWGVLYSELSEPDAVAVIENLKKAGYPYKLSDDKQTILVPEQLKEDLRVMIAQNDIIHDSNPGFELLDKMQLGATDFQNKLTKQRIFQGELTRTIEKIDGIKKARVQLADPERSIFDDRNSEPSASVMLILEPGVKLKKDQIKAVKNLVAYSIPRLKPEKVFITDQAGSPLSDEMGGEGSGSDISDYRIKFENDTSKKVQKVIEKLVGQGNVSVEISAVMNFDSARSTIERYIPSDEKAASPQGIVATAQTESEVYGKDGNGPASNPPAAPGGQKNTNYEKTKQVTAYNISKEVRQVVYAPGSLQRMTIAVALNKILTSTEKNEIKNLVISASGADTARGDVITITGMQFAEDDQDSTTKIISDIQTSSNTDFWVRTVAPMLVVLVLGLSAIFVLKSFIGRPLQGEEVYEGRDHYAEDGMDDEPELLESSSIPMIEAKLEPELERMKSDLNNIIMTDPAEAARLLLSYIKE